MRRGLVYLFLALMGFSCTKQEEPKIERDIRPFDWKEVYTLPNEELEFTIINRIGLNEYGLFIHDFQRSVIHRIDLKNSALIQSYGGVGRGPGEMGQISNFSVDGKRLIVIDNKLLRFTGFDIESGNVIRIIKSNATLPYDIIVFEDTYMVAASITDSLVSLYDLKTNEITSSASILDLDVYSEYSMSLSGKLFKHSDESVLFMPIYDHRIFEFIVKDKEVSRGRVISTSVDSFTFKSSIDGSSESGVLIKAPDTNYMLKLGAARTSSRYVLSFHLAGSHPTQRFV